MKCHSCGGTEVEHNDSTGDSVCTGCGAVLEENRIVSAVEFAETPGGQGGRERERERKRERERERERERKKEGKKERKKETRRGGGGGGGHHNVE
jgi:transcription initiation factor TFIIIB Brf1 subunit/transcription initiation factor TFIIB